MPAIPEILSSAGYGATPQPTMPINSLTSANDALTAGMQQVTSNLGHLLGRMTVQKQVNDAAQKEGKIATDYIDMQNRYANDPDPTTAPARFQAEANAYRDDTLRNIPDEGTRGYVAKSLSLHMPVRYGEVVRLSAQRAHQTAIGTMGDNVSNQAQSLANATNTADESLAVQGMKSGLAGNVAAGTIDQPTMNQYFSKGIAQAGTIIAATDPARAARLLDQYAPEMSVGDVAALRTHLEPKLKTQYEGQTAQDAGQYDAATSARAQLVHDGMIARGLNEGMAHAAAVNAIAESHANPNTIPGDGGISHGLFQWNKTRLAAFQAQYGHLPEAGTLDEALDFTAAELKGTYATAAQAIEAAPTAAAKARAFSTYYLQPKDIAGEEARRTVISDRLTTYGYQPNLQTQLDYVKKQTADQPFDVQQRTIGRVYEAFNNDQRALAPARADLHRQLGDLGTGYDAGMTTPDIPLAQIRTLLPPQDQQRVIDELTIRRNAGDFTRAAQWATPAQEQAIREYLAVPGSLAAQLPRKDGHMLGLPAQPAVPGVESSENAALRLRIAAKFEEGLTRKHQALLSDPAAYTASAPEMAARAQAIDSAKPETQEAYIDASLQLQRQLGLRESQTRVQTDSQIASISDTFAHTDPATADTGAMIDSYKKQLGKHWPQAYGELVRIGKVSPEIQLIADMDRKGQAFARADLQRVIVMAAKAGGMEQLRQNAPPDQLKDLDKNLEATMAPFRATTAYNQDGDQLFNTVKNGVKALATGYLFQGLDADDALAKAYQGIIGEKYDIRGTMRVDKSQANMTDVTLATNQVQQGLTADQLATPPARPNIPGETDAARRDAVLTAAKNGKWVPNRDSSGLVLMATLRNGDVMPVHRADGSPVELRFNALPPIAPPAWAEPLPDDTANAIVPPGPYSLPSLPPMPTGPDLSRVTNRPVGAALGDWIHGSTPGGR